MGFDITGIGSLLDFGGKIIDKVIPDPAQKDKAKLDLLKVVQSGDMDELKISMSAIIAEANSKDGWTSRARPSFMYVMYTMILASIPMGILTAFNPEAAQAISAGMKGWLGAIPEEMWTLFGVGYLGYSGARSFDKRTAKKGP